MEDVEENTKYWKKEENLLIGKSQVIFCTKYRIEKCWTSKNDSAFLLWTLNFTFAAARLGQEEIILNKRARTKFTELASTEKLGIYSTRWGGESIS